MNISKYEQYEHGISISSREKDVRNQLKDIAEKKGLPLSFDNLGSTFMHINSKKSDARTLMISFAMDECGYMVSKIYEDGSLGLSNVSNQPIENLLGQEMLIRTRDGKTVEGFTTFENCTTYQAQRLAQSLKIEDCRVLVASSSKQESEQLGIHLGDAVVIAQPLSYLKPYLAGRALDVCTGLYVMEQLAETFSKQELDINLVLGGVVQEKVAYRGAVSSTTSLQPDVSLSLAFEPESKEHKLGSGSFVKAFDKTLLPNWDLFTLINETTEMHSQISDYGTSASFIHKSLCGVPSAVVGIHVKNASLNTAIAHEGDIQHLLEQLRLIILKLHESKLESLIQLRGSYHEN